MTVIQYVSNGFALELLVRLRHCFAYLKLAKSADREINVNLGIYRCNGWTEIRIHTYRVCDKNII